LIAVFFFYPANKILSGRRWACYAPFLLVHLAMFIFWMSLSYVHYKTFWAFWILAVMAAASGPNEPQQRGRERLYVVREPSSRMVSDN
jgi:hypothetical protein